MNIRQLESILEFEGINKTVCKIKPQITTEGVISLNLLQEGIWNISLNERGTYILNEIYQTESDACNAYLIHVFSEPTYFKEFKQSDLINWKSRRTYLIKKYKLKE